MTNDVPQVAHTLSVIRAEDVERGDVIILNLGKQRITSANQPNIDEFVKYVGMAFLGHQVIVLLNGQRIEIKRPPAPQPIAIAPST